MNSSYGQCSLFLLPEQHNFTIKYFSSFIPALRKIGFISHKTNADEPENNFFTGDKYLEYVAYMGCAPSIQFDASETSDNYCQIKIHHHKTPQLIHNNKQSISPHCPNCKKPVKYWQDTKTATTIYCNQCNITSNIENFNWRKMAGYAQLFIEITDIFPKEAIPQQLLLDKLSGISGIEWQYFYSCQ